MMKKEYKEMMDKVELDETHKANILLKAHEKAEKKNGYLRKLSICLGCIALLLGSYTWYQQTQVKSPIDNNTVMIPNPLSDYPTMDDLKAASFDFAYPSSNDYKINQLTLIASKLVQLEMSDDTNTWTYRIAQGSDDVSGDYNQYDKEEVIQVRDWDVTFKGNGTLVQLAIWHDSEYSYSLTFESGVEKETIQAMVESIC